MNNTYVISVNNAWQELFNFVHNFFWSSHPADPPKRNLMPLGMVAGGGAALLVPDILFLTDFHLIHSATETSLSAEDTARTTTPDQRSLKSGAFFGFHSAMS